MARVKLLRLSLFILLTVWLRVSSQVELMCEVANVEVESEDGRTQTFEMKKVESVKGEACALCAHPAMNSAPEFTALKSSLLLSVADKEISSECDPSRLDLPSGLCSFNTDSSQCTQHEVDSCIHTSEELAEEIVYRKMVPLGTGDDDIDRPIAISLVMLNAGNIEGAVRTLDMLVNSRPNSLAGYFMRGVANARRGLKDTKYAELAIDDFNEVLQRDAKFVKAHERRAEAHISLGHYKEAIEDLTRVIELSPHSKALFARGVVYLLIEDFVAAEVDFKSNLERTDSDDLQNLFYLGLSHYYRGKVRNAIEVFKEVLKKDSEHLDACTSLGQAFREVGNFRASKSKFNQSLAINKYHILTLQLRGDLFYHSGEPDPALSDFDRCLEEDPGNVKCGYMKALSKVSKGKFYEGVKAATKVMVKHPPIIKASPEFLKAHYLREYARYLHSNLDTPIDKLDVEEDFTDEYKDHWLKNLPFEFEESYKEQPGIQPHIKDVVQLQLSDYPRPVQNLICKAHRVGWMTQVTSDGYTPNKRLNLIMGLSSIHIAQIFEARWRGLRQNKPYDSTHGWRDLFDIAVKYRKLVDPDQPVLWLDKLPDHKYREGYKTVITMVKGAVHNIKTVPYFDLVFKLVKTMLEHYSSSSDTAKHKRNSAKEDIESAKTCKDLLEVTKKHQGNQNGFVVSTQVPSTRKRTEKDRLEGAMQVLADDIADRILFTIEVANTRTRTADYHAELDYIYNQLQDEIRRTGSNKVADMDSVVNIILSLVYYFYNLMPLSRGSSVVAYSVALGLLMSVGKQVTGKIPSGKLLEMEAMLSGAPDAFILVTKQWMNLKRLASPMSGQPNVWETFPTVSVVAYSVALGLLMSVGKQVTGKIPSGKLLEMEAMLSGAPDAFILVTKQWMNLKRLASPMSGQPNVWETFPTVSVVAYSVALGLLMSVGKQVTGKIPSGKLLEMEAMLSGAPDAFILVTKQWMNLKRLASPMSGQPNVWETFPTVRHVLELLNVNTETCA